MTAPDYDWEMDSSLKAAVSCVSLGSYCAVAACLNHLKLRTAAYPFDWNRTTIEGVIHFLQTGFVDFLSFLSVKDFPGGKNTGGKAYCGAHHSVWHEDLAAEDGTAKYRRRISRFFQNAAPRKLFIRCLNASVELSNAAALLQVLQRLFPGSKVHLLLIVVCQSEAKSFIVDGTEGQLLVHLTPHWSGDGILYADAVRAAYAHAGTVGAGGDEPADGAFHFATRSLEEVLRCVQPYFGGPPQQVPFMPQLLYIPRQIVSPVVVGPPSLPVRQGALGALGALGAPAPAPGAPGAPALAPQTAWLAASPLTPAVASSSRAVPPGQPPLRLASPPPVRAAGAAGVAGGMCAVMPWALARGPRGAELAAPWGAAGASAPGAPPRTATGAPAAQAPCPAAAFGASALGAPAPGAPAVVVRKRSPDDDGAGAQDQLLGAPACTRVAAPALLPWSTEAAGRPELRFASPRRRPRA